MPETAGPYRIIETADGESAPWYVIPFDKKGRCKAPRTRENLLDAIDSGRFSHVFVFSHGWNNDWKVASSRYAEFVAGFSELRRSRALAMPAGFAPLLIGVFWPSTSLVLPWERAPRFAAAGAVDDNSQDEFAAADDAAVADLAEALPDDQVGRFYQLVEAGALNGAQALELARLLLPALDADDELPDAAGSSAEQLVAAWAAGAAEARIGTGAAVDDGLNDEFGTVADTSGAPAAAGIVSNLDPRHALRMASVWRMKDRAGTVGAHGVAPLIAAALAADRTASFHLIGHSYGAKVVLSACAIAPLPRALSSMLLLQPAVSGRCFAADADGHGNPGGYRPVLERVEQPILTTFSRHDFPLTRTFHLAVRRASDLGEQRIAGQPPSRFAALGGYGPDRLGAQARTVAMKDPGRPYDEIDASPVQVLALNGDHAISGHGDISNPYTWWALYEQVRRCG